MSIGPERLQRVIYAKYLLRRAQSLNAEGMELASAEAVLVAHDAVEMLLRVVIDQTGAKTSHEFLKCWDNIKDATGTEPPSKIAMDRLNHARVGFKHKGIPPNPTTVADHLRNCVTFCNEASHQYLSLDFDSVSLADLIQHDEAQKHVRSAEDAKVHGDMPSALTELGLGWDALLEKARSKHASGLVGKLPRRIFSRIGVSGEVNEIVKWLESIATTLDSIIVGVEPAKLRKFNKITPIRTRSASGKTFTAWTSDPALTSEEDYAFCYAFVIDFALLLLTD